MQCGHTHGRCSRGGGGAAHPLHFHAFSDGRSAGRPGSGGRLSPGAANTTAVSCHHPSPTTARTRLPHPPSLKDAPSRRSLSPMTFHHGALGGKRRRGNFENSASGRGDAATTARLTGLAAGPPLAPPPEVDDRNGGGWDVHKLGPGKRRRCGHDALVDVLGGAGAGHALAPPAREAAAVDDAFVNKVRPAPRAERKCDGAVMHWWSNGLGAPGEVVAGTMAWGRLGGLLPGTMAWGRLGGLLPGILAPRPTHASLPGPPPLVVPGRWDGPCGCVPFGPVLTHHECGRPLFIACVRPISR